MSTIADDDRRVIAGVDTHKDFHVVVVLDELGRKLDTATFSTTTRGYRDLTGWVTSFGEVLAVGVEGTASWGAGLSRHLRARGLNVIEVNRPDRHRRRRRGRSDPIDAEMAARAVLAGRRDCGPQSWRRTRRSVASAARRSHGCDEGPHCGCEPVAQRV